MSKKIKLEDIKNQDKGEAMRKNILEIIDNKIEFIQKKARMVRTLIAKKESVQLPSSQLGADFTELALWEGSEYALQKLKQEILDL